MLSATGPSSPLSLFYSKSIQSILNHISSGSDSAICEATQELKDVSTSLASHGSSLSRYDLEAYQKKVIELSHILNEKRPTRATISNPKWKTKSLVPKPNVNANDLAARAVPLYPSSQIDKTLDTKPDEPIAHLSDLSMHRHFETEQTLTLHDIAQSTLTLSGKLSNVFITELHDTTLDLSQCSVSSSILVRNCQGLTLVLHSCSQLRFSACANCCIEAGPNVHNIILETCTAFTFPTTLARDKIVDFDWHKTNVPSPNWTFK